MDSKAPKELGEMLQQLNDNRLTRRQFVRKALAIGLSLPTVLAYLDAAARMHDSLAVAAPTPPSSPKYGGTLVLGYAQNVTNMDPPRVIGQFNNIPWYTAYDGLIRLKPGSGTEFEPALAQSWETSPDGLTKVFRLRRGVRFHDGASFNAESVVFSFMRIIDQRHPYYKADMAPGAGNLGFLERVEAIDEFTVRMTLKWPFPYADQMLATYDGLIVDPATIRKFGDESSKHENGTGPFRLTEWREGDRMVFTRYDAYWAGRPYLDRFIVRTITEPSTQLAELLAGNVHVVEGITDPRNIRAIRANPNLQIQQLLAYMQFWLKFNLTHPVLRDKRVRQAINHAINRENISKNLYQGLQAPAKGWLPEIADYFVPSSVVTYDPGKAKRLLGQAGYANGFEMSILLPNIPTPHNIVGPQLAVAIQADLAKVGIRAKLNPVEYATLRASLSGGFKKEKWEGVDTWMDGIRSIVADTDNFLFGYYRLPDSGGFGNFEHYYDARTSHLIDQARQTVDPATRKRIYGEIQKRLTDFVPHAPLFQSSTMYVTQKEVQGFSLFPVISAGRWNEVWLV